MAEAPFFIVGSGRSGSTLLRAILASHSRLMIPPETWYLLPLIDQLGAARRPLGAEEVERIVRIMTSHYRWPDMNLDADDLRHESTKLANPVLGDVVEIVYRKHLERARKPRWGDKSPGYIKVLPQLAEMFAGSLFIHLHRDGRDVAKSFQERSWYGPWFHDNTREWCEAMEFNERWSRSRLRDRILQVRYADLVLETERIVRDICAFLGEQFEPQMLSWQGNLDELIPSRELPIHRKLTQIPEPADVSRWKREMPAREVLVCEAFMHRHLEKLGYELNYRNCAWLPMFMLTRCYCRWVLPILGRLPTVIRKIGAARAPAKVPRPTARDVF